MIFAGDVIRSKTQSLPYIRHLYIFTDGKNIGSKLHEFRGALHLGGGLIEVKTTIMQVGHLIIMLYITGLTNRSIALAAQM